MLAPACGSTVAVATVGAGLADSGTGTLTVCDSICIEYTSSTLHESDSALLWTLTLKL